MDQYLLYYIMFNVFIAFYLSELDSTFGLIASMTFFPGMAPSSNFFKSPTIAATDLSPNSLKPLDACISVNIKFSKAFMYVYVLSSPSC